MRPPLMRLPRRLPLQVLQIVLSQTHGVPYWFTRSKVLSGTPGKSWISGAGS